MLWHSDLHIPPWQLLRMTPAEINVACDGPGEDGRFAEPDNRAPGQSVEQYAAWWRSLTPEQRLAWARERYG